MIVALVQQKGGVGKTTFAVNLAVEALCRGKEVLLVDADPQGSACDFALAAAERFQVIPPIQMGGEEMHISDEIQEASREGLVLLDTPGRMDAVQRSALMVADLALLPCGPSPPDAWALDDSVRLVRMAQQVRRQRGSVLRAAIVLSRTRHVQLHRGARGVLEMAGLPLLRAEIRERIHFQEAMAAGQGVSTYAPMSKAAAEVAALYDEIMTLGGSHEQATKP